MPLDFPSNPVDGQVYGNYFYSTTKGAWRSATQYNTPSVLRNINATTASDSLVPLTVTGYASQSANLQEWKNNSDITLASLSASGGLTLNNALTVGNGGTGATSLTSGGYLKGNGTAAIQAQSGIPAGDITSGTIAHARMPSGSIVQTAFVSTSNRVDISSQDPVAITGLSISFTPRFSDSNILLQAMINSNEYYVTSFTFLKNGSSLTTTSPNSNTNAALFTLFDADSVSTNMRNAYLLWSDPAGSTTARTYAVGGTSSWAGTINTLIVNDRSDNVMRSYSTFAIFEVRP